MTDDVILSWHYTRESRPKSVSSGKPHGGDMVLARVEAFGGGNVAGSYCRI